MSKLAAQILTADCSPVFLPQEGELKRLPRKAVFPRPAGFFSTFEERALIYDCFWNEGNKSILLLCPPPMNLEENWLTAKFATLTGGKTLDAKLFKARSSMIVELVGAPKDCAEIAMEFAGNHYVISVQKNTSEEFADKKIIFTMNKDNQLNWIVEWAQFHQTMHNADAVILFDNGSNSYSTRDIEHALAKVDGLDKILVVSWPFKFGSRDPGVIMHPYWAHFLQNSSFSLVLRRLAAKAFGLLNMDIDELADPIVNSDVFELTQSNQSGFHVLEGNWVESIIGENAATREVIHRDFTHVLSDFRRGLNAKKWVLDPKRDWLADLNMQPSWHKIKHMPEDLQTKSTTSTYWHFKGINTNWKQNRTRSQKPSLFCQPSADLTKMHGDFQKKSTCQDPKTSSLK